MWGCQSNLQQRFWMMPLEDVGEALVQQEMEKYTSAGGVPSFIINGK